MVLSFGSLSQKNELSIESYQNFRFGTPASFGSFDTDFIGLNDGSDQSGTKFSLALNYTRKLGNDWFVRVRPGMSFDSREDHVHQLYYGEFGYDKYEVELDMNIQHTTLNLFAGVGKDIQFSERFSLMVGVDLGFMADLTNSFDYDLRSEYHYEQSDYFITDDFQYKRQFAKYRRIGIMPIIAPKFQISPSFSISAELQFFGALSMTNGEEHYLYKDVFREYNPSLLTEYLTDTDLHFNSKASMFSISKLSPLLRFTYEF